MLKGLGQVVESSLLHGLDRRFHRAERGDHEDHLLRVPFLDGAEHLESAHARKHQIEDHEGMTLSLQLTEPFLGRADLRDVIPGLREEVGEDLLDHLLVIHQQDSGGGTRRHDSCLVHGRFFPADGGEYSEGARRTALRTESRRLPTKKSFMTIPANPSFSRVST